MGVVGGGGGGGIRRAIGKLLKASLLLSCDQQNIEREANSVIKRMVDRLTGSPTLIF